MERKTPLTLNPENLSLFWSGFKEHIENLEQMLSDKVETVYLNLRIGRINSSLRLFDESLSFNYSFDSSCNRISRVYFESVGNWESRQTAITIANSRPEEFSDIVSVYRLPSLTVEQPASTSWYQELAQVHGDPDLAEEIAIELAGMVIGINGGTSKQDKLRIKVGLKSKIHCKVIGLDMVYRCFEGLLGDQIVTENIESIELFAFTDPDMMLGSMHVNALNFKDVIFGILEKTHRHF